MTIAILIVLVVMFFLFIYVLFKDIIKHQEILKNVSIAKTAIIGFVVNFFDVLGIGAFALQTAQLKFTKRTEDCVLPRT